MKLDGLMLSKSKFTKMVEETVRSKQLSYMDAVIHLSETHNIELSDIKKFISRVIAGKIEAEAEQLNFLRKKRNTLPLD